MWGSVFHVRKYVMDFYHWKADNLYLSIHVQLHAKQTEILCVQNDKLKVKVSAPPVDGRANVELCEFFAKLFGVAKSHVTLVAGQKGRDKRLCIKSPKKLPDFLT